MAFRDLMFVGCGYSSQETVCEKWEMNLLEHQTVRDSVVTRRKQLCPDTIKQRINKSENRRNRRFWGTNKDVGANGNLLKDSLDLST